MLLASDRQQTKFFPGDLVKVRPLNEILATLGEKGTLGKRGCWFEKVTSSTD